MCLNWTELKCAIYSICYKYGKFYKDMSIENIRNANIQQPLKNKTNLEFISFD